MLGALFRDKGVSQVRQSGSPKGWFHLLCTCMPNPACDFDCLIPKFLLMLTPPSHRCGECLLESSDRRVCIHVNPLVCFVIQEGLPAIVFLMWRQSYP